MSNGSGDFGYKLRLRLDATELSLAFAYASFCSEKSSESPHLTRRKLDDLQSQVRSTFIEKQKLKTDLSILEEKIVKAEKEQLTREVDYELFIERNPKQEIRPLDRILYWRASTIKEKEESTLKKKSEPVRIARALKDKLVKEKERLVESINALEKAVADSAIAIEELEKEWIGSVYRQILDFVSARKPDEALKAAKSFAVEFRNSVETNFLLWLVIETACFYLNQTEQNSPGKPENEEGDNERMELAYRCIQVINEFGEPTLSATMNLVSSGEITRVDLIPPALPEHFRHKRAFFLYEMCKLLLGIEPSNNNAFPKRTSALLSIIKSVRQIEAEKSVGANRASSLSADTGAGDPFDSVLQNAVDAMDNRKETCNESDAQIENQIASNVRSSRKLLEPGDYGCAYRGCERLVGDVVTSLVGHYAILTGCADRFLSTLAYEAIDLSKENVNTLAISALAYKHNGLNPDNVLINLLHQSETLDFVWYTLSAVIGGAHLLERAVDAPKGLFAITS